VRILALAGALLLAGASPDAPDLPLASGPVPADLPGGTVVHTGAVARLVATPGVVLLDVGEAPRRPATLPPGAPWLPPEHRDIPGSVWIPGAGRNPVPPDLERYFRARLAGLAAGSAERPIVVYCHPNCWGSWIAARRAQGYGYRNVFWYPDGIEGWEDAHLPTAPAVPERPSSRKAE
jgi:PQQ-dependent catabolism-associated CXXCW motif protein